MLKAEGSDIETAIGEIAMASMVRTEDGEIVTTSDNGQ